MKNRPFRERLGFAAEGLLAGWRRERSFRTQSGLALIALAALLALRPAPVWWALVALVSALVLAFELVNSALEALVDLLHPGQHPEIKAIKDMLAGAVLLLSIAALVIGALLLADRTGLLAGWGGTA